MREYYDYEEILLALEDPLGDQGYESASVYIDPTTDFGFKRIFGMEANKDLLLAFLNVLFRGRKRIDDLHYNKNEHVGIADDVGAVIFDLTCTASNGEQFIIEVQRAPHFNLKRRMVYYGSKIIADQAPKGRRKEWNYRISEVYVIVIMDSFVLEEKIPNKDCIQDIYLCNRETGEIFYEDFGFIYIALANFVKEEAELENDFEGWLYILKNMAKLDKLPSYLRKPIFEKLFDIAAYSKMNKEDREMYDVSLKRKWDAYSYEESRILFEERAVARALERGLEQGIEQGLQQGIAQMELKVEDEKLKAALKMLDKGFDLKLITELLSLTESEIHKLNR